MSDTAPALSALRQQIDALDAQLLRLIDERAALAGQIGAAKAASGDASLLKPDREALLLRKLLATPRRAASDEVIVRVWHELISENLRIQGAAHGGLKLALSAKDPVQDRLLWARDRFGAAPAVSYLDDAPAVITAARQPHHIGVLSLDARNGAWWARLLAEADVRVIAALPESSEGRFAALSIAAIQPEPTGDDVTFWVSDSRSGEADILDDLSLRGFAADFVMAAQGVRLFAIAGFVQENDDRLKARSGELSGIIGSAARL